MFHPIRTNILLVGNFESLQRQLCHDLPSVHCDHRVGIPDALASLTRTSYRVVVADQTVLGRQGLWLLSQVRKVQPAAHRVLQSRDQLAAPELLEDSQIVHKVFAPRTSPETASAYLTDVLNKGHSTTYQRIAPWIAAEAPWTRPRRRAST